MRSNDMALEVNDLHKSFGAVPVLNRPDETPDKWHTYEIRCRGSHLMVFSDGVTCIDVDQSKVEKIQGRPLRGFLGLQGNGAQKKEANGKKTGRHVHPPRGIGSAPESRRGR